MDLQTAWIAIRSAGIALTLLLHGVPEPVQADALRQPAQAGAMPQRHIPHAVSADQLLASRLR